MTEPLFCEANLMGRINLFCWFFLLSALQLCVGQVAAQDPTEVTARPTASDTQNKGMNVPALQQRNPLYTFRVNDSFRLAVPV